MRDVPELFPKRQGRPETFQSSLQLSLYARYNTLWEEYVEVKELLDKLLNEMVQQQEKMLIELKQMKLHLASLSNESIDEKDISD